MPRKKTTPKATTPLGRTIAASLQPSSKAPPHIVVRALAGTGKTTTLVEGLKCVRGINSSLTPSPQQKAVWDAMYLSRGASSICFCAFNKGIAEELQRRVPMGCDASTMHSLGLKAITRAFGRVKVESFRVSNIISEILEKDIREIRRDSPELVGATERLVALCKQNLSGTDEETLLGLAGHYEVEMNGSTRDVFALVPKVIERCKDVTRDNCIDFNDMIWLPIALNLSLFRYDLLLVDEAQDLNRCQQELAFRSGKRLVFCGDEHQAIYGFAGADSDSIPNLVERLSKTSEGVVELPLTVTRRCGRAIVEESKRIVPHFEAHESNTDGKVSYAVYDSPDFVPSNHPTDRVKSGKPLMVQNGSSYHDLVADGDRIVCRVNAPLVSQCFRFLKAGRKATIQGRDVGAGLISTIKKVMKNTSLEGPLSIVELSSRLSDWLDAETKKEMSKRNPSESRMIALQDRYDCLNCFCEDADSAQGVIEKIERIFTDNKDQAGIRLSSIHKAKGLEADRVFFLMPKGGECPHPMAKSAWQRRQEMNLLYVGITRAIKELVFVS